MGNRISGSSQWASRIWDGPRRPYPRLRKKIVPSSVPRIPHEIQWISLSRISTSVSKRTGRTKEKQTLYVWTSIGSILHHTLRKQEKWHPIRPFAFRLDVFNVNDVPNGGRVYGPNGSFSIYIGKNHPLRLSDSHFGKCNKFTTFEEDGYTWYEISPEAFIPDDSREEFDADESEDDETEDIGDVEMISDLSNQHDLVVLLSGGLDSALLLAMAKEMGYNPVALMVDYGQKHVRELEAAIALCRKIEVPYRKMNVDLGGTNSGLTGSLEEGLYQDVHPAHVPGRNTLFTGLALNLAESIGVKKIWYGANMEDRINEFPDCTQEWIHEMNKSTRRAGSIPIELEAPLLGMRKDVIKRLAKYFGIDEKEVHSGYAV